MLLLVITVNAGIQYSSSTAMAERRVEFCALVVVGLLMGCSFAGLLSEATYVLSSIQEYPNKQGFEAELELIQHTTNLTLGPDITPLHVIVRYRHREREGPHKCPLWTPFIYSVNSELLVRSSQVTFLRKKLVHKILLLCFGKFWYDFNGALNSLN